MEYTPEAYDCVCPVDVVSGIPDLTPGTITVDIYVNASFSISGETTIPFRLSPCKLTADHYFG